MIRSRLSTGLSCSLETWCKRCWQLPFANVWEVGPTIVRPSHCMFERHGREWAGTGCLNARPLALLAGEGYFCQAPLFITVHVKKWVDCRQNSRLSKSISRRCLFCPLQSRSSIKKDRVCNSCTWSRQERVNLTLCLLHLQRSAHLSYIVPLDALYHQC